MKPSHSIFSNFFQKQEEFLKSDNLNLIRS